MMLYNEQSQPGPSNMQDGSLLHESSHAQGILSHLTGFKQAGKLPQIMKYCYENMFGSLKYIIFDSEDGCISSHVSFTACCLYVFAMITKLG